jgi:hypothetical protein
VPVGLSWVDSRAELSGWVENLVLVLDGETIDEGEDFGEVLFVGLGGDEKVVDHVHELDVGERGIVDDGAVGYEQYVSDRTK